MQNFLTLQHFIYVSLVTITLHWLIITAATTVIHDFKKKIKNKV